ncbi:hypothetical protein COO60DRAFT_1703940 [Scenedesmus sp. NREL 46B-D3]|nr:hypothetical protein COO60DRAFT_1703940 [Scenedesmus sp. NREL 46B-D3]
MEPKLCVFSCQELLLPAECGQSCQNATASNDVNSSSWTSSCHRIARRSPSAATRHAPYPAAGCRNTASNMFNGAPCPNSTPQQHQAAAVESTSPVCSTYHQQQLLIGSLRQQPLESLLELAITLAGKSLSRTMEAFQVACNCWAFSSDSAAAAQALEVAEGCMARAMQRMLIVQQLAAAVLSRKQSQALVAHQAQQQQQQQQQLMNMMQELQGQYLGTVLEDEDEGEEAISSWKPAAQL